MKCTLFSVVAVCALLAGPLMAHTIDYAPVWRGDDRSTFQKWTFDTAADPATPEAFSNPYGTPAIDITVDMWGAGWINDELSFGTQSGYWDLGSSDGSMVIDIDNAIGGDFKLIDIQITYWQAVGGAPAIDIPGAVPADQASWRDELIEFDTLGGWRLLQAVYMIAPNPDHEQIILTSDPNGTIIDQIIVDTVCIPEPTTLALLTGGLAAAWRKRR